MPRQMTYPNEDKHKAPSSTPPRPLSLQDAGALPLPDLIVNIHQVTQHLGESPEMVGLTRLEDKI
jgi:hypothetical protein